jgi:hypothetical protein
MVMRARGWIQGFVSAGVGCVAAEIHSQAVMEEKMTSQRMSMEPRSWMEAEVFWRRVRVRRAMRISEANHR